ncbi:MAG TPA: AAA family ATPase, partial [Pyrinomonadaceae bacterium]|nr:AAA family ATPase [Pyrinomonadaceae bacterium]
MEDILEIKSANEWVREAKRLPVPKMLFGEFWLENELAIMFAETGMGKSALAVQIAESIARGAKFQDGFGEVTAKPQRVLYLDFELSRKQFEMRYAADHDEEKGEFLQNHYIFSDRFKIYRPKPEDLDRTDAHPFETVLRRMLEPLIESSR